MEPRLVLDEAILEKKTQCKQPIMDTETVEKAFQEAKSHFNMNFELKREQLEVATSVLGKRDVLCFLPTGYGKTLCMVIPTIINRDKNPITLIVSPLMSLIDDQLTTLKKWNFTCAKIQAITEMDKTTISGIENGDFQFVLSSPESILKEQWRKVFLSSQWQSRLHLIAIDEAHCISEWGEDFRKDYQNLSELRSFFSSPVMALTATITPQVKKDIMKSLTLDESKTDVVFKSPNRPNIYIQVKKRESTDYSLSLNWLIEHIKQEDASSRKTIVYCRSIDTVSQIFLTLKECLGDKAYAGAIKDANNLLIEMYHKSTHEQSKTRILSQFKSEKSNIRCIIATVALGMGLDITDIDLVVHIGCPKSVLSYWQEAGRCARDGRQGFSLILYDNFTLALKTTDKDVADIIKNPGKCVRQQIINLLTIGDKRDMSPAVCQGCESETCPCDACKCCSVCCVKCPCQERSPFDVIKFISKSS